jgi:hypothetical protein
MAETKVPKDEVETQADRVAQLVELMKAKNSPQPMQLPLREIFMVLAAASMVSGLANVQVDEVGVALKAKRLADKLFAA